FTFGTGLTQYANISPDGRRVVFQYQRQGATEFLIKPTSGDSPETTLFASADLKNLIQWSADGRFIIFRSYDPHTGQDLYVLRVDGDRSPIPYLRSPFNEWAGALSPDDRWMAYASDESGQREIYVQSFPKPGVKYRVSTEGGGFPVWRADGRE